MTGAKNKTSAPPVLTNSESSIVSERTDFEITVFFYPYFIKIVEIKAVCNKHFNSPSLLFFPCIISSQQKVFWKLGVSNFFVEILEKH